MAVLILVGLLTTGLCLALSGNSGCSGVKIGVAGVLGVGAALADDWFKKKLAGWIK